MNDQSTYERIPEDDALDDTFAIEESHKIDVASMHDLAVCIVEDLIYAREPSAVHLRLFKSLYDSVRRRREQAIALYSEAESRRQRQREMAELQWQALRDVT